MEPVLNADVFRCEGNGSAVRGFSSGGSRVVAAFHGSRRERRQMSYPVVGVAEAVANGVVSFVWASLSGKGLGIPIDLSLG